MVAGTKYFLWHNLFLVVSDETCKLRLSCTGNPKHLETLKFAFNLILKALILFYHIRTRRKYQILQQLNLGMT